MAGIKDESSYLAVAEALYGLGIVKSPVALSNCISGLKDASLLVMNFQIQPVRAAEFITVTFNDSIISTATTPDALEKIGKLVGFEAKCDDA